MSSQPSDNAESGQKPKTPKSPGEPKSGKVTADCKAPKGYNPFIREDLFPDIEALFAFVPEPIETAKESAVFVLDACTMLLPYATGKVALAAIRKTYSGLVQQGRLIVPHQAAREFAAHRLGKITDLYDGLKSCRNSLNNEIPVHASASLDALPEYVRYCKIRGEATKMVSDCRDAIDNVIHQLREWYYDDPVLTIYRDLFGKPVLLGPAKNRDELVQDSERRNAHLIPPGCAKEDASKPDGGIGDKLIWHTMLRIAEERKCHLVFVTQDLAKRDWVHSVGKDKSRQVLFPRYELTEEFRRASGGKTLHIVDLATLLTLFTADAEAVKSVREAQADVLLSAARVPERELLRHLRRVAYRGSRSFDWLRKKGGIPLTDDQFQRLIHQYPDQFRACTIIRRDEKGQRVIPGLPGLKRIGRKMFL